MRTLFRLLLWLHPAEFRERFGDEILCIFDEASGSWSSVFLIGDTFLSLLRRWPRQPQPWQWAAAMLGGFISLFFGFGGFLSLRGIWEAFRTVFLA